MPKTTTKRLIPNLHEKSIAIDFDGVLNNYTGYDEDHIPEPRPGAKEFLIELSNMYNVIIFSARSYTKIIPWLNKYNLQMYVHDVTGYKPKDVVAFIDDRGITFNGDYEETLRQVKNFKPYWQKNEGGDNFED